jgi:hypothetical protein
MRSKTSDMAGCKALRCWCPSKQVVPEAASRHLRFRFNLAPSRRAISDFNDREPVFGKRLLSCRRVPARSEVAPRYPNDCNKLQGRVADAEWAPDRLF